jgi:hypothetical protein
MTDSARARHSTTGEQSTTTVLLQVLSSSIEVHRPTLPSTT